MQYNVTQVLKLYLCSVYSTLAAKGPYVLQHERMNISYLAVLANCIQKRVDVGIRFERRTGNRLLNFFCHLIEVLQAK